MDSASTLRSRGSIGRSRIYWGLEFGAYGNRIQNAMRTHAFVDRGIRRPQIKSMGSARMRISVMTSKAVATCHRIYYQVDSAEMEMKVR